MNDAEKGPDWTVKKEKGLGICIAKLTRGVVRGILPLPFTDPSNQHSKEASWRRRSFGFILTSPVNLVSPWRQLLQGIASSFPIYFSNGELEEEIEKCSQIDRQSISIPRGAILNATKSHLIISLFLGPLRGRPHRRGDKM